MADETAMFWSNEIARERARIDSIDGELAAGQISPRREELLQRARATTEANILSLGALLEASGGA